jgi:hypothetical protein
MQAANKKPAEPYAERVFVYSSNGGTSIEQIAKQPTDWTISTSLQIPLPPELPPRHCRDKANQRLRNSPPQPTNDIPGVVDRVLQGIAVGETTRQIGHDDADGMPVISRLNGNRLGCGRHAFTPAARSRLPPDFCR